MKAERQSNIELLRIMAIIGVIVLHYNNVSIGGGLLYVEKDSLNFYILYFLESLFICSVDLFMLISGFFMCSGKSVSLWKPIKLITQVIAFSVVLYIARLFVTGDVLSVKSLAGRFVPANYFVILYCCVYILSPFINFALEKLNEKIFKNLMICLFLLFSFYPTFVDLLAGLCKRDTIIGLSSIGMYGSQWGYNIVNFILLYITGAYAKKFEPIIKETTIKQLLLLLIICVLTLATWARMNLLLDIYPGHNAWEYCNPIVIHESIIIFLIFRKIDIGANKVINKVAECVFSVFLLHGVFMKHIRIEWFVNGSAIVMLLHILGSSVLIYMICSICHFIYSCVEKNVFGILERTVSIPVIKVE